MKKGDILKTLVAFFDSHDGEYTLREIADGVNLLVKSISAHITTLARKGHLKRSGNRGTYVYARSPDFNRNTLLGIKVGADTKRGEVLRLYLDKKRPLGMSAVGANVGCGSKRAAQICSELLEEGLLRRAPNVGQTIRYVVADAKRAEAWLASYDDSPKIKKKDASEFWSGMAIWDKAVKCACELREGV